MKWVIRLALVAVVLVVVVCVVAFWQMDRIATVGLQKAVAFATQCDTSVDKVDVSPFAGEAQLNSLEIKNPEPFQPVHEHFIKLGSGKAAVDLGTLRKKEVVIPEVTIDGVELTLVGREGKTNYETILESIARLKGEDAPKQEEDGEAKQYTISKVTITNVVVHVDMDEDPVMGLAPVKLDGLKLKPIVLTDVGSGGVPLSQISADLIADILVQVVAQLGSQLGDRVLSGLTNGLSSVVGGAEELQAQIGAIAEGLGIDQIDVNQQLERASELGSRLQEGVSGGAEDLLDAGRGLINGGDSEGQDDEEEDGDSGGGGILDRF